MHADKADKAVKGSDSRSDSRPVPAPEGAGERDFCTAAGARCPLIVKPPPPLTRELGLPGGRRARPHRSSDSNPEPAGAAAAAVRTALPGGALRS